MAVNQIIDLAEFHKDVRINAINIQDSYLDQASLFAHYAALQFKAEVQSGNMRIVRDTQGALIDQEIRAASAKEVADILLADPKAKPEKLTEAAVMARRNIDPRYQKAMKDHIDDDAIETFIKNALIALSQRKDMLISLGSTQRKEMDGELRLNASAQNRADLLDRARAAISTQ